MFGKNSLSGSMIDNGFCVQSPYFVYLLDLEGDIIGVFVGNKDYYELVKNSLTF